MRLLDRKSRKIEKFLLTSRKSARIIDSSVESFLPKEKSVGYSTSIGGTFDYRINSTLRQDYITLIFKGGENLIYENVKKYADKLGLSIREVERRAGLENGAISKWVGDVSPRLENAMRVAEVLGIPVQDLVKKERMDE